MVAYSVAAREALGAAAKALPASGGGAWAPGALDALVSACGVGASSKRGRTQVARQARVTRIQLEQDSGKSSHTLSPVHTLVDLNRAGVALLEVVTAPDFYTPDEAAEFLRKLHHMLRHAGVAEGAIEEGGMRCDVNVSLRHVPDAALRAMADGAAAAAAVAAAAGKGGDSAAAAAAAASAEAVAAAIATCPPPFGRVELKNIASIRAVERAIESEAHRQLDVLHTGGWHAASASLPATTRLIERETRVFDAATGTSTRLRSKEEQLDYRYGCGWRGVWFVYVTPTRAHVAPPLPCQVPTRAGRHAACHL